MTALTQTLVKELMEYDPETGDCFWKPRNESHQPDLRLLNSWNTKFAWKKVGFVSKQSGYMQTALLGKQQQLHRLIWLYVYGEIPETIDHIDSVRTNNRILNLRSVSQGTNNKNAKRRNDNKTGVTGIRLTENGKWLVRIRVNKKLIVAGRFDDFEEAVKVRNSLEKEHGFHSNHGKK